MKPINLILPPVLAALLAACADLPPIRPGELILDTRRQVLCFHAESRCRELSLIVANNYRARLLAAYGLPPWNWSRLDTAAELRQLLLHPPGDGYQPQRLGEFRYRLPVNHQTRTAWEVLNDEYLDRYCDPGDQFNC